MITLTHDQQKVIDQISAFFAGNSKIFLLKGSAGTGKTTIIRIIIDQLKKKNLKFALMAPTGKAAGVIRDKTNAMATTIHSAIYEFDKFVELKEPSDKHDPEEDNVLPLYKFALKDTPGTQIYIVDEASMIGNSYSEGLLVQFGSGYLLDDLVKYSGIQSKNLHSKIIFVGDPYQLPPVGSRKSFALDVEYLEENYDVLVEEGELLTPVRFKDNAGLLENSTFLRDRLISGVIGNIRISENDNCSFLSEESDLPDTYLSDFDPANPPVIIASTNSITHLYNETIRERLYGEDPPLKIGERLMVIKNHFRGMGMILYNGDLIEVVEVNPYPEEKTIKYKSGKKLIEIVLTFRSIKATFETAEGKQTTGFLIIDNLLFNNKKDLTHEEVRALYLDFLYRHKGFRKGSPEFLQELMNDNYFNALRVKFSYAITCHKAQGSEWNKVFVDPETWYKTPCRDYLSWLYTAITRSKQHLYLLSDGLHQRNTSISFKETVPSLILVDDDLQNSTPPDLIKKGVSGILYENGFRVVGFNLMSYRIRVEIDLTDISVLADIIYNGQMRITSYSFINPIGLENLAGIKRLTETLDLLKNKIFRVAPAPDLIESGTPTEPAISITLLQRINDISECVDARVSRLSHFPWRERYEIATKENLMTMDISYKKNGTLTLIEVNPEASTSEEFVNEISSLILKKI